MVTVSCTLYFFENEGISPLYPALDHESHMRTANLEPTSAA
jgi:hypothetical protein